MNSPASRQPDGEGGGGVVPAGLRLSTTVKSRGEIDLGIERSAKGFVCALGAPPPLYIEVEGHGEQPLQVLGSSQGGRR